MSTIRAVEVVIPARNEAQLIERCLGSIAVASAELTEHFTHRVLVSITVVADGCLDETAALARAFAGVHVLELAEFGVGAARRAGISVGLARQFATPESTWFANTDADSCVAVGWLRDQIMVAEAGADVRLGGVRPDFADLSGAQIRAWKRTHRMGRATGHVHGANLGIRASSYLSVGGFRPLEEHEDVDLVRRARRAGARIESADESDVLTSGRSVGRTPGGYARYLHRDLLVAAGQLG